MRRFVTAAAPLIDLRMDGDPDGAFRFAPARPRGLHPVLGALEDPAPEARGRCTAYRPADRADVVWLHPGEPVFDRFCAELQSRHGGAAQRGACFVDPHARRAGLTDWPGFNLLSIRPGGERRAIEVKGRAGAGDVELSEIRMGQGVHPAGRLLAPCRPRRST